MLLTHEKCEGNIIYVHVIFRYQIESREKHQTKKVSHEMALPDEKLQISQKNHTEMCHRQT